MMTNWERLADESDVILLYRKYGGSKALRRVAELAFRHGANRVKVSELGENEEWTAEIEDIQKRFGFAGYSQEPFRLDFLRDVPGGKASYQGYALVRPKPNGTLLEALVPPPRDTEASYLTCESQWHCDPRDAAMDADGCQLWGCKFVQQDTHSGVCAHACIRSVSILLNSRFGQETVTFPEITARAGCRDPRAGLTMSQMKRVLRSLGCNLLEFSPPAAGNAEEGQHDAEEPPLEAEPGGHAEELETVRPPDVTFWSDEVIYRYVESGLPVLVGIETPPDAHTFFVVGHTFERDAWWPEAREGYYPSLSREYPWIPSSLWSGSFYIQDDNFGPYMSMPKAICRQYVRWVLVPVPKTIGLALPGEKVEPYTAYLLYDPEIVKLMLLEENNSSWKSHLRDRQIDRKVVLRTMLVKGDAFRESVLSDGCCYPSDVKEIYRQINLPDWLWLVEVSVAELYGPAMMKLGEVLIDPAASGVAGFDQVLALHLPGVMWPSPSTDVPVFVDDDRPTNLYSRPTFAQRAREMTPPG